MVHHVFFSIFPYDKINKNKKIIRYWNHLFSICFLHKQNGTGRTTIWKDRNVLDSTWYWNQIVFVCVLLQKKIASNKELLPMNRKAESGGKKNRTVLDFETICFQQPGSHYQLP